MNQKTIKKERLAGLDLLRILAMFLITLSHIAPSITSEFYAGYNTEVMFIFDVTIRAMDNGETFYLSLYLVFS